LGPRAIAAVISAAWLAASARAAAAEPPDAAAETDAFLARYYPPPIEGPELRLPVSPTRLWLDAGYARADDLSSLPYITGKAWNARFAAGGSWRWGRFAFTGELPLVQATTINVDTLTNISASQLQVPSDAHQTAVSLGDLRVDADWTDHLGDAIVGGFGLRARLPTHTTGFTFHLADGSTVIYRLPYYFHLEPTAILGAAVGRFAFVVNQGAIVLIGPDGDFEGFHIHVPTITFWDAAYAVSWAPLDELGASVELSTDIQLNHVEGADYATFNHLRSVALAPAIQWHVGGYRVDLVARYGFSKGADLFGIMEFSGTTSYTLRVTRPF
jgi:hypothetical protein